MEPSFKSKINNYNLNQNLRIQSKSLKTFNYWMYAILAFSIIFVIVTIINIFFEFRAHLCIYSNTKKCVASDKICKSNTKAASHKLGTEIVGSEPFSIINNTTDVVNQTVAVEYYTQAADKNIDPSTTTFDLDFNFTDSVPETSSGLSNVLTLGPSAGYAYHTGGTGVSIYLYPFNDQTNLEVEDISQINYIITQSMLKEPSGSVIVVSDPIYGYTPRDVTQPAGVFYSQGLDNQFYLGTYIQIGKEPTVDSTIPNTINSNVEGQQSLFNYYATNGREMDMKLQPTSMTSTNITELTKITNLRSQNDCNKDETSGCACLDPAVIKLPFCGEYYYDTVAKDYKLIEGDANDNSEIPDTVKFCSYFNNKDNLGYISANVNKDVNQQLKEGDPTYYFNGFGETPTEEDANAFNRYQLPAIFCSNQSSYDKDYNVSDNKLYEQLPNTANFSGLCAAYNSTLPNYIPNSDGSISLGHPG